MEGQPRWWMASSFSSLQEAGLQLQQVWPKEFSNPHLEILVAGVDEVSWENTTGCAHQAPFRGLRIGSGSAAASCLIIQQQLCCQEVTSDPMLPHVPKGVCSSGLAAGLDGTTWKLYGRGVWFICCAPLSGIHCSQASIVRHPLFSIARHLKRGIHCSPLQPGIIARHPLPGIHCQALSDVLKQLWQGLISS